MKIDSRSEQSRSTMWLRTFGPSFLERSETWSTWRSCDGGNTYDNKPEDDDMELVQKMAEKHSSWIAVRPIIIPGSARVNVIKLRGYFSDLRTEEATQEDHPNKNIQQLREMLWIPERL